MKRSTRVAGVIALGLLLLGAAAALKFRSEDSAKADPTLSSAEQIVETVRPETKAEYFAEKLQKARESEKRAKEFSHKAKSLRTSGEALTSASIAARAKKESIIEKVRKQGRDHKISDAERQIIEEANKTETEAYDAYREKLYQIAERN